MSPGHLPRSGHLRGWLIIPTSRFSTSESLKDQPTLFDRNVLELGRCTPRQDLSPSPWADAPGASAGPLRPWAAPPSQGRHAPATLSSILLPPSFLPCFAFSVHCGLREAEHMF